VNPLLFPIIAVQGLRMRSRVEILPPATGPTVGTVGAGAAGPPVRIAVLGESSAAGCGAETHDDGFPGSLARELAGRTHRPVAWEVVGQYGATARRIRHRLLPQLGDNFTVAVLLAGANDVLNRRSPTEWADDLTVIVAGLADRAEHVVVVGLPPFKTFPSLPTTLGRYLTQRADTLNEISQRICAQRPRATWIHTDGMQIGPDFFARDGFHPSAFGYLRWAKTVASQLTLSLP
jgi:lysophospholipase L1-like esterase